MGDGHLVANNAVVKEKSHASGKRCIRSIM
jgi:hypothetical protein